MQILTFFVKKNNPPLQIIEHIWLKTITFEIMPLSCVNFKEIIFVNTNYQI